MSTDEKGLSAYDSSLSVTAVFPLAVREEHHSLRVASFRTRFLDGSIGGASMDMKEILEKVRIDLRERPNSHFSEVYFRLTESKVTTTEVHNALYELLKRDEVATKGGKWRLF
jgi:hypothetical protein